MKLKLNLFTIILLLSIKSIYGIEFKDGLRIGYQGFGGEGVSIGVITDDKKTGVSFSGSQDVGLNNLYLAYVTTPYYFVGNFGANIKFSYNEFYNKKQKILLDDGDTLGAPDMWRSEADLGTVTKGRMLYLVSYFYYHFFREKEISLLLGIGVGMANSTVNGDVYITDKYADSPANYDQCEDYIKENKDYPKIGENCDLFKINKNNFRTGAIAPSLTIQGENIGVELGWVNTPITDQLSITSGTGGVYYLIQF